MKTISELLIFKNDLTNRLKTLNDGLAEFMDQKAISLKMSQINNFNAGYDDQIHQLIQMYQNLDTENQKIVLGVKQLIDQITVDIDALANQLFNTPEFQSKFANKEPSLYPMNQDLLEIIKVRIRQYGDWHYPGLQLNTREKQWIDCMITCDPLYLVGENIDQLNDVIKDYPKQYQDRLRLYTVDQFGELPQEQFGFILCWNLFEYCTITEIEPYLNSVYNLLRPGGVFMFSYNNCDVVSSAKSTESEIFNYNTVRAMQAACEKTGYEVLSFEDGGVEHWKSPYTSWAEIKKPGELSTVKAHQALGKILPK